MGSNYALASFFGLPAMQAIISGQAAVGVAVSAIQLLTAFASVKTSPTGATIMEEKAAETRSAFVFFALSTVFYVFSAGAYAWLIKTPEYRDVKGSNRTRRVSISLSSSFTADGEETGLVSGRSRDVTSSPIARTLAMVKTNLPFNFTVAWVFTVTLVRGKNWWGLELPDIRCSPFSHRSQCLYFLRTLQPTASSSALFTSLSSTQGTFRDD